MGAALTYWRWGSGLLGVSVLSAVLWNFGPLMAPLQDSWTRIILIVAALTTFVVGGLALDFVRRRRQKALAGAVADTPDPGARAADEEAGALRERMGDALALLKKARGPGYLYEQPWYVFIGPPGAGKTTALINAGLRFPLAAEMGLRAVSGVGGTRLCDWWFTEDAVLIDTAGRYTTQDSDAAVDRAGWEAFLNMLKRARLRRPLNGVIVSIAVTDIAAFSREERLAVARAARSRIKDLEEKLGVRLPIYLLLTKADLIAGFTEFFDDLDRERRGQVWGATFALTDSDAGPIGRFGEEFKALVERLNEHLFDRLQAERSPERRTLIAGFPAQFASLEVALAEFLGEAFAGSRLDRAPMLRGFYLTSGTQEGAPIDRLTGFLARSFGIDQRRAPSLRPEQGRSYFLGRLMKEVIFGEAMLVSERPGAFRRRLLMRGGAFAAIALVFVGGALLLWWADSSARRELAEMRDALGSYNEIVAKAEPLDPVASGDPRPVLPLLDAARALPHGYDQPIVKPSWWRLAPSLDQKLAVGARAIYRNALERVLLPRMIWQLEADMRGNMSRPDFLYEAIRVYLMLGALGPIEPTLVGPWMQLKWSHDYSGPATGDLQARLWKHFTALLEAPLPKIPLDGALIPRAQAVISNVPAADRVYAQISSSPAARAIPPWRPGDALGQAGASLFYRPSGKPLSEGIPGFYTIKGFYDVLLPALPKASELIASESWALGDDAAVDAQGSNLERLERDVIARYEADYERRWDAMLADLELSTWRTPEGAVQNLYLLAGPQSPMRALMRSIARQLTLSKPEETAGQPKPPGDKTDELKKLFPNSPDEALGKEIDDHYRALRDYVGDGGPAPLDEAQKAMDSLRQELAQTGSSPGAPPGAPPGGDPVLLLRAQEGAAPAPMKRWLHATAQAGGSAKAAGVGANLRDAFNGGGSGAGPLCRQVLAGRRYPFDRGASDEIGIEDFAKLFSPTGLFNTFFNNELRPYVDTSSGVWRVRTVDGVTPSISPGALAAFEQAAKIRDAFFPEGGGAPAVRFVVTEESLDSGAQAVTLQLGDTMIHYARPTPTPAPTDASTPAPTPTPTPTATPSPTPTGPATAQIVWPGPSGTVATQLSFDPPPQSGSPVLQTTGSWALFRLLDKGSVRPEGANRNVASFALGERRASFQLRTTSVLNPFAPGLLRGFQCPSF